MVRGLTAKCKMFQLRRGSSTSSVNDMQHPPSRDPSFNRFSVLEDESDADEKKETFRNLPFFGFGPGPAAIKRVVQTSPPPAKAQGPRTFAEGLQRLGDDYNNVNQAYIVEVHGPVDPVIESEDDGVCYQLVPAFNAERLDSWFENSFTYPETTADYGAFFETIKSMVRTDDTSESD